jgi:hypothetical protein
LFDNVAKHVRLEEVKWANTRVRNVQEVNNNAKFSHFIANYMVSIMRKIFFNPNKKMT